MQSLFPFVRAAGEPRWLFCDMNAFYASVEQQECAKYRDKPTIVVPLLCEHTCAIAASYEAKQLGIKTGTNVRTAQAICPNLQIVEARPELYLAYHQRLVDILNRHFATIRVLSVDEMACRVPALLCKTLLQEQRLAERIKEQIACDLGPFVKCSIGIAPNVFLAKVASDCRKPDGLTLWTEQHLPDALFALKLTDLPGIGSAMKRRLNEFGIETVQQLWEAEPADLRRVWRSVLGERWYFMLRGSQEADYRPLLSSDARKSVGHSNVLAPQHRSREGAERILLELFAKALKRLRAYQQVASAVHITVKYHRVQEGGYSRLGWSQQGIWTRKSRKHLHANDEPTWLRVVRPLLQTLPDLAPAAQPAQVSIVFSGLLKCEDTNLSLFPDEEQDSRLMQIIDALNKRRPNSVHVAGLHAPAQVPRRIPFGAPDTPID